MFLVLIKIILKKKIINDNPSSQYQKLLKELTSDEIAEFNELKAQKNSNIYGVWFEKAM